MENWLIFNPFHICNVMNEMIKMKKNDKFDLVKEKEKDENGLQANHSCGPRANLVRANNDFF